MRFAPASPWAALAGYRRRGTADISGPPTRREPAGPRLDRTPVVSHVYNYNQVDEPSMALNQVDEPSMALSPDEPLRGRAARDHGLQFKDRSFATGNMPCEVVDFEVGLVGQTPHHGTGTDGATPSGNTGTHGHTVTHRRSTSQPSGNHPNPPTHPHNRATRPGIRGRPGGSRDTPPVTCTGMGLDGCSRPAWVVYLTWR